ncbi:hypothetical protein SDC9_35587 [bioreactor metagenome]|jgi:GNAT superfamily N-acetyltransferase|uniref:N-acetyltransferase domain-containing protein n=1 Tax=bioreactor metagenome TaxID=1076179 RepID=A0A644VE50_9ZZZZ|nr:MULTISPECIES: GNAT family N-acetyltransferase [Bacteroidales]OJX56435.1 MAG: hypothetical protein BGO84_03095 [Dysgonomonas sp. 37-18]OJX90831.1 MAG: hypothetical protein BGP01_05570 [Paludibacter sp. 47-17]
MLIIRPLKSSDSELLRDATYYNLNWNGNRFSRKEIDENPHFAHYFNTWLENSDFGFVAERHGKPFGVVWLKYFPSDNPGYGFIAENIPELSICMLPNHRGLGIGTELIKTAINKAKSLSIPAISLSVEMGNSARNLYLRTGFKPVDDIPDNSTLILYL